MPQFGSHKMVRQPKLLDRLCLVTSCQWRPFYEPGLIRLVNSRLTAGAARGPKSLFGNSTSHYRETAWEHQGQGIEPLDAAHPQQLHGPARAVFEILGRHGDNPGAHAWSLQRDLSLVVGGHQRRSGRSALDPRGSKDPARELELDARRDAQCRVKLRDGGAVIPAGRHPRHVVAEEPLAREG